MFYFKPGDKLSFEIDKDTFRLTGKENTKENKEIEKWHHFLQPLTALSFYSIYPKLEEEYAANKDLVFISISSDRSADKEKWRTMVKEKQMKGIQLFAGDDRKGLFESYGIKGIPRFILIDRQGNNIYSNAPRPSSEEIRAVLNEALKR